MSNVMAWIGSIIDANKMFSYTMPQLAGGMAVFCLLTLVPMYVFRERINKFGGEKLSPWVKKTFRPFMNRLWEDLVIPIIGACLFGYFASYIPGEWLRQIFYAMALIGATVTVIQNAAFRADHRGQDARRNRGLAILSSLGVSALIFSVTYIALKYMCLNKGVVCLQDTELKAFLIAPGALAKDFVPSSSQFSPCCIFEQLMGYPFIAATIGIPAFLLNWYWRSADKEFELDIVKDTEKRAERQAAIEGRNSILELINSDLLQKQLNGFVQAREVLKKNDVAGAYDLGSFGLTISSYGEAFIINQMQARKRLREEMESTNDKYHDLHDDDDIQAALSDTNYRLIIRTLNGTNEDREDPGLSRAEDSQLTYIYLCRILIKLIDFRDYSILTTQYLESIDTKLNDTYLMDLLSDTQRMMAIEDHVIELMTRSVVSHNPQDASQLEYALSWLTNHNRASVRLKEVAEKHYDWLDEVVGQRGDEAIEAAKNQGLRDHAAKLSAKLDSIIESTADNDATPDPLAHLSDAIHNVQATFDAESYRYYARKFPDLGINQLSGQLTRIDHDPRTPVEAGQVEDEVPEWCPDSLYYAACVTLQNRIEFLVAALYIIEIQRNLAQGSGSFVPMQPEIKDTFAEAMMEMRNAFEQLWREGPRGQHAGIHYDFIEGFPSTIQAVEASGLPQLFLKTRFAYLQFEQWKDSPAFNYWRDHGGAREAVRVLEKGRVFTPEMFITDLHNAQRTLEKRVRIHYRELEKIGQDPRVIERPYPWHKMPGETESDYRERMSEQSRRARQEGGRFARPPRAEPKGEDN